MALRFGQIQSKHKTYPELYFLRISNLHRKIVEHVAVIQVNAERSWKSAQNERRSFH